MIAQCLRREYLAGRGLRWITITIIIQQGRGAFPVEVLEKIYLNLPT